MLENKTYKNLSRFPPGKYYNQDLGRKNKIFVQCYDDKLRMVNDFKDLRQEKTSTKSYFSPSYFPLVTPFDYHDGSCFENWMIPPSSFYFDVTDREITVSTLEKNISLPQYMSIVEKEITESIRKIYENHSKVYLQFSGGIDSIVILSFIEKLNFLNKTHLIYYHNLPECFAVDDKKSWHDLAKKQALDKIFQDLKNSVSGISIPEVNLCDMAMLANHVDFDKFTPYATHSTMLKFPDAPHIGGFYANQSLLHWVLFMDDLLLAGHDIKSYQAMVSKNSYAQEHVIKKFNIDDHRALVPLEHKHMILRNRMSLGQCYYPLMTNNIAIALRCLDFRDVGFEYLVDAKLARDFIHNNVGLKFDEFIISDGMDGGDNLSHVEIPLDLLDHALFQIYPNINHDQEGCEWHRYEIERMKTTGVVPLNTLVSFKSMQFLESLLTGKFIFDY